MEQEGKRRVKKSQKSEFNPRDQNVKMYWYQRTEKIRRKVARLENATLELLREITWCKSNQKKKEEEEEDNEK